MKEVDRIIITNNQKQVNGYKKYYYKQGCQPVRFGRILVRFPSLEYDENTTAEKYDEKKIEIRFCVFSLFGLL